MATGLILMRRVLTFLTAITLLVASLTVGVFTADLPFWRRVLQLPLPVDALYLPVATIGATPDARPEPAPPVATPAGTAGFDETQLESAVARARAAGSRALLVMDRENLVLSRYFGADDERTLLPAGLIARPLAAMAMGLALADGRLESLDTPVAHYLPEWDDEARGRITLRQLLDDTSGLETGGEFPRLLRRSPWKDVARLPAFATAKGVRMLLGNDFADTALRYELRHEPGGFYNQSPANPQLLALILERATQQPYEKFIDERLWRPLGAGRAEVALDRRAGMPAAHCCWRASAPDMLRMVSLLANHGAHRGRAVLPEGWVREMASASRVNADSGMQLRRATIGGLLALSGRDDDGNMFWAFPDLGLAMLNIVNSAGASPPELPGVLLQLFRSDRR